jgi:hypothetical protein
MPERFDDYPLDAPPPDIALPARPLPPWLADRFLRPDEHVTLVRGPRWQPACERFLTHPGLFVIALVIGVVSVAVGRLLVGSWSEPMVPVGLAAGGLVLASIFILGIAATYFTRLVATNFRLFILQGRELVRNWDLDDLPRSLVRYDSRPGQRDSRSIDLGALQTMLGATSEQFVEAKTILSLGKHLDHIKAREKDRR